MVFKPLTS